MSQAQSYGLVVDLWSKRAREMTARVWVPTDMTSWSSKAVTEKVDAAGLDLGDGDLGSAPLR